MHFLMKEIGKVDVDVFAIPKNTEKYLCQWIRIDKRMVFTEIL